METPMHDPEERPSQPDQIFGSETSASEPTSPRPPSAQAQDPTTPEGSPQGPTPVFPWSATQPQTSAYPPSPYTAQYRQAGPSTGPYYAPYGYAPPPSQQTAPRWPRQYGFVQSPTGRVVMIGTVAVLALALLSGIGYAVVRALNSGPQGYLFTSDSEVTFIQWTEDSGHHLSGTMQDVQLNPDESVKSETIAFTGVHDGSQISITVSELGLSSTLAGTLNGDALTLAVPDQSGLLATEVFHLASVEQYNSAVSALRQRAQSALAATQSAQATADTQQAEAQATASTQSALDQAVTSANSQLASDLNALSSDVQNLKSSTGFSDALSAYATDWAQMQKDYQQEQTDYQQGCGTDGSNAGTVAYDAGNVQYDLGSIQYDDGTLSYDHNSMSTPLANVQSDITSAQTDWQNLQVAVAADTTGDVLAQFTQSDVDAAVSAAHKQLDASNSAWSQAQSQGSQYDQEATQMNTTAQNLANSMHC